MGLLYVVLDVALVSSGVFLGYWLGKSRGYREGHGLGYQKGRFDGSTRGIGDDR